MFKQVELSYAYDALEPHIDALTMETHYSKHHAAYTNNLNAAVEKAGVADKDIVSLLGSLDSISDEALRGAIRNNGGGYYNHNLYFAGLSPNGGGQPDGELAAAIEKDLGGFDAFKDAFGKLGIGRFGSGWAWLSANKEGKLQVSSSPNQDNPIIEGSDYVPILGLDVWEHAYYLKYKNLRADYIQAFYDVVDWKFVAENYKNVKNG
ncbi:superoxide dismutase [Scatolibacter rhodanostii]|uniref:superoxide dismutase n=1 Tax=Scatolibacter rhodanostii TaxID=2014781 RepID=UPI000C0876C8|nr:superoxide dismutase [Scatolibacter rhodanostii]